MSLFNYAVKCINYIFEKPYAIYIPEKEEIRLIFPDINKAFTLVIPLGNYLYQEMGIALPEEEYDYLPLSPEEITALHMAHHYIQKQTPIQFTGNLTGPLGKIYPINDLLPCLKAFVWRYWKKYAIINNQPCLYLLSHKEPAIWRNKRTGDILITLPSKSTALSLHFPFSGEGFVVVPFIDTPSLETYWDQLPTVSKLDAEMCHIYKRATVWLTQIKKGTDTTSITHTLDTLPVGVKREITPYLTVPKLTNSGGASASPN